MITKPTLLLDETKCRNNIETLVKKAKLAQVDFRPHFKTHQSLEIGSWFKALHIDKITVSSLDMADYFATEWKDITVAFPVNILEIDTINRLAAKIQLNILIESVETMHFLKKQLAHNVGFFIKMDVGYHRTGLNINDTTTIDKILATSSNTDKLTFKGFLAHAGHTYHCNTTASILAIHRESLSALAKLKTHYLKRYPDIIVSVGDTPSCSIATEFTGIDEIRPGNFVFYDLKQNSIGSCDISQIAVAMACPIVAIHPQRNEIIVYGGGVHFTKEGLNKANYGIVFGLVVEKQEKGWGNIISDMHLKSLSQEHGTVAVPDALLGSYKVGDILYILPVHSCMTANAMKSYTTIEDLRRIERL